MELVSEVDGVDAAIVDVPVPDVSGVADEELLAQADQPLPDEFVGKYAGADTSATSERPYLPTAEAGGFSGGIR